MSPSLCSTVEPGVTVCVQETFHICCLHMGNLNPHLPTPPTALPSTSPYAPENPTESSASAQVDYPSLPQRFSAPLLSHLLSFSFPSSITLPPPPPLPASPPPLCLVSCSSSPFLLSRCSRLAKRPSPSPVSYSIRSCF